MTKLEPGKKVVRETLAQERRDAIVIELHARHLVVRLKGKRLPPFEFSYERLLQMGYVQESERVRRERLAGKRARPRSA